MAKRSGGTSAPILFSIPSSSVFVTCPPLSRTALHWLHRHGMTGHILPRALIDENKWRAMRYGLDGEILDFTRDRRLTMRESISELLDFVDEVVDDLGSRSEINYLRALLADKRGTGADRQIEVYRRTGSIQAVTQYLMQQTLQMYQPS